MNLFSERGASFLRSTRWLRLLSLCACLLSSQTASAEPQSQNTVVTGLQIGYGEKTIAPEMVFIGNPDNPPDSCLLCTGRGPLGDVPYDFWISRFEITAEEYAAFLNAVAKEDTHELFREKETAFKKRSAEEEHLIIRLGSPGKYSYSVRAGYEKFPVFGISWFDAARFANWMHNGQPGGPQNASTTENGAYDLTAWVEGSSIPPRNEDAKFWIPNQGEWHKAAFFNPEGDQYNQFATGSDEPTVRARFNQGRVVNPGPNTVADMADGPVGASGNRSFYGVADMMGGVGEWTDTPFPNASDGRTIVYVRGGGGGNYGFKVPLKENARTTSDAKGIDHSSKGIRLAARSDQAAYHASVSTPHTAPQKTEAPRVSSADAASHIGQTVIVRGNVATVRGSSRTGMTYINFGKPYPDMEFAASFETSNADLANVRELEGRQGVEIEGTISADARGRPQLVITSTEQVKSRGEPGVQRPPNQTAEDSNRSASSPGRSDATETNWERLGLRSVAVEDLNADLVQSLKPPGTPVVLRGRLIGVTDVERWPEGGHKLWITPVGANPAVSVQAAGQVTRTLEELQELIGHEIELPASLGINADEKNGGLRIEGYTVGWSEPRLSGAQAAEKPAAKLDPFALFSHIPRLAVAELQKMEFPEPDQRGRTPSPIRTPVVIIGKLRSILDTGLLMSSGVYGPPVTISIEDAGEELGALQKLAGTEIAVVANHVLFDAGIDSRDGILIVPVTFLHEGRIRPAVFPVEELGTSTQTQSRPATPASEEHGSIGKTSTTSPAPESPAVQGTLLEPLRVELKRDGKVSGSTTLKAGTPLPIVRQEGVRALVKHPGGETWLQTGNEWEAIPIIELEDRFVRSWALAPHSDRPAVAWITKEGLWFAELKGDQWQIELVDGFPEGEKYVDLWNSSRNFTVSVGKDGAVVIAYYLKISHRDRHVYKVARRSGSEWTIEGGLPAGDHAIRMTGETPEVLSVGRYGSSLSRWKDGEWRVERLPQPRGSETLAGELSDAGVANFLALERPSSGSGSQKDGGQIQLRHWLGDEWKSELIAPTDTPQNTFYGRTGLALAGEHKFAVYPRTESSFFLARSSGSWQMQELNPSFLGEKPRLLGIDASADGVAFLLFQGIVGKEWDSWKNMLAESKRPDLVLSEMLLVPNALAVSVDSDGHPTVLFQDADQNLSIATRKRAAQLATSQPANGVLQLPSAPLTSTVPKPPLILPRKIVPGSEADLARRIASLTTTFSFPVDGEMTKFTRWGSGDKLIVFFNNNGEGEGPDGKFDSMPKEIEGQLQAYTTLLDEGYSLVVWDYPRTPRLAREVGEMNKKPDLAGIAATVVEGIRKETGASEMLLVGNSMGAGVVLWDLDKIASIDGVRTLLISPTEFFMPSIDHLGDRMSNTTLIAIEPDPFLRSPEIMAWAAKHASPPGGILEADQGKYIGHLIIGMDRLTHQEVLRLIRKALQPANQANDSSND